MIEGLTKEQEAQAFVESGIFLIIAEAKRLANQPPEMLEGIIDELIEAETLLAHIATAITNGRAAQCQLTSTK